MPFRSILLLTLALAALAPVARATTVVPPSFSELVSGADAIYRGRVTGIEARRVDRAGGSQIIKTFVTLAVEKVLKGAERTEVTLEFLGGTIGDESLNVVGMPKFAVGAREIVFVQNNGTQFCPLVGMMHGRYKILRDTAASRDYVTRDDGAPLTHVSEVQLPIDATPAQIRAATAATARDRALTPAAFEASIAAEAQRLTPRPLQNN